MNQILTSTYLEEESVSISAWPEFSYFAHLIGNNFQSINRGHQPRHGILNNPICLVCQHVSVYSNAEDYETENKMSSHTEYEWEKLTAASILTQFCGRRELGLLTLSAVVHLRKMMLHTMSQSIQILCERQIYWMFPLFCAQTFFLLFLYARFNELCHFGFASLCTNSRLCCTHISDHRHKTRNVWRQLMQNSKRQHNPC